MSRNPAASGASPLAMIPRPHARSSSRSDRIDRVGLWVVLLVGLLLMLAAALSRGEEAGFTASRTDRFNATLGRGATLRIENVSGDILASPGKDFSASVATTVAAPTKARVEELLGNTVIVQTRDGEDLSLETRWPDSGSTSSKDPRWRSSWFGRGLRPGRCQACKIAARYEIVVPHGVRVLLHTVNGEVRVSDLDGALEIETVNGDVLVRGARAAVAAQSVNGKIEVGVEKLPSDAPLRLNTVNGSVSVTLPKEARFSLSASTMNGTIASTFPLPARPEVTEEEEAPRVRERAPRAPRAPRRVIVHSGEGDGVELDLRELEKELDQTMKEVEVDVRESLHEAARELKRIRIVDPRREYSGSIGQGGASLRLSTLNGSILVLANGTKESDAKPLVSRRRSFAVTIPQIPVDLRKPVVRVKPAPVVLPRVHVVEEDADEVVLGQVAGDFLSTTGGSGYRIGKVSGRVKILTHSGEIQVESAGAGADVTTFGGDIRIGSVHGDLKAKTLAGDVRAGSVSGSATAETSGGDVRIDRVDGSIDARTAGGDIVAPSVVGAIQAQTGGGEVRIGVTSREARGGISIRNAGGDVSLTLPADFRGEVELVVSGADSEESSIRSDFPEIAVTRRAGSQYASGTLNGGGSKVFVRTSSGAIRLGKSPPTAR